MLQTIYKKYYLPPVGVTPRNRCFSAEHIIISSILFTLLGLILSKILSKDNRDYTKRILKRAALLMLVLEIFRISWNWYYKGFSLSVFRFDYCNQICMLLPIIVLTGQKQLYPYIDLLSVIGGLMVLIYPLWVFYDYAGFHLLALQSMISHALMLLCGILMPLTVNHPESERNSAKKSLIGFSIILIIAFIMSHVTGDNYFLMKSADGIPLLEQIPFPAYWLIVLPITFGGIDLLSILYRKLIRKLRNIEKREKNNRFYETKI